MHQILQQLFNQLADCGIEFCLASIDPNGNPTNGITRTQTSQSSLVLMMVLNILHLGELTHGIHLNI